MGRSVILDRSRKDVGIVSPPWQGAHFVQDGNYFDAEGRLIPALSPKAPAPLAIAVAAPVARNIQTPLIMPKPDFVPWMAPGATGEWRLDWCWVETTETGTSVRSIATMSAADFEASGDEDGAPAPLVGDGVDNGALAPGEAAAQAGTGIEPDADKPQDDLEAEAARQSQETMVAAHTSPFSPVARKAAREAEAAKAEGKKSSSDRRRKSKGTPEASDGVNLTAWAEGKENHPFSKVALSIRRRYHTVVTNERDAIDKLIKEKAVEPAKQTRIRLDKTGT